MEGNFGGVFSYTYCTYNGTFKVLQQGLEESTCSALNRCFFAKHFLDWRTSNMRS